jgi:hypothetical protein
LLFALATASAFSTPRVAFAASAQEKAMASQLFDDAEKLMAEAKFPEACPKYAESHRIDPQLGTLLHLAECYERWGKTASAWASFKDGVEIAVQRSDPREQKIRERVVELEKKLPKLIIAVPPTAPADLEVTQDGDVVGRAVWNSPVPIDPGVHDFAAKSAGKKPWSQRIQIASAGGTVQLAVPELGPADSATVPVPPPIAQEPAPSDAPPAEDTGTSKPGKSQRILGWVTTAAGVVGIGVGIGFALKRGSALSDRDALCPANGCPGFGDPDLQHTVNQHTEDARSAQTISIIGFAAGGALTAAGLILVFTAPTGQNVALAPVATPQFQGLTVAGTL